MECCRRLRCLALYALVFGCAVGPSGEAEEAPVYPDQRKRSLSVRNHRLRGVVSHFFAGTGVRAHVERDVPDVRITVRFRRLSLQQGLRVITRAAAKQIQNLTQSKDGDEFFVRIRKPVPSTAIFD